jgi:hypothetical protein
MYSTITKSAYLQQLVRIPWLITIINVDATISTVKSFDSWVKIFFSRNQNTEPTRQIFLSTNIGNLTIFNGNCLRATSYFFILQPNIYNGETHILSTYLCMLANCSHKELTEVFIHAGSWIHEKETNLNVKFYVKR